MFKILYKLIKLKIKLLLTEINFFYLWKFIEKENLEEEDLENLSEKWELEEDYNQMVNMLKRLFNLLI